MKQATGYYTINNWDIVATPHNDWELIPAGLTTEQHENFYNNNEIRFKKLSECKKYVKSLEAQELRNKYV